MFESKEDRHRDLLATVSLPPALPRALRDLSQHAIAGIENHLDLLKKLEASPSAITQTELLCTTLQDIAVSRKALLTLPKVMCDFQQAMIHPALMSNIEAWKWREQVSMVIRPVLAELAGMALNQHRLNSGGGMMHIGEGAYNWVFSDTRSVVYIAKNNHSEGFDCYRRRAWCAKQLNELGLEQPTIQEIGRLPVLHAIGSYAPGKSLSEMLWTSFNSETPAEDGLRLAESCRRLGSFVRQAASISTSGVGELRRQENGEWSGMDADMREYLRSLPCSLLSGSEAVRGKIDRLLEMGIYSTAEVDLVRRYSEELLESDEQTGMVHGDPHLGNFQCDAASGKIVAFDWDSARSDTLSGTVARVCWAWTLHQSPHQARMEELFVNFIEGVEPDPGGREQLLARGMKRLAVWLFDEMGQRYFRTEEVASVENEKLLEGAVRAFNRCLERIGERV